MSSQEEKPTSSEPQAQQEQQLPTEPELKEEVRELYVSEKDKKVGNVLRIEKQDGFSHREKQKLDKILVKLGFPKSSL